MIRARSAVITFYVLACMGCSSVPLETGSTSSSAAQSSETQTATVVFIVNTIENGFSAADQCKVEIRTDAHTNTDETHGIETNSHDVSTQTYPVGIQGLVLANLKIGTYRIGDLTCQNLSPRVIDLARAFPVTTDSIGGVLYVGNVKVEAETPPKSKLKILDTQFFDRPETAFGLLYQIYPDLQSKKAFDSFFTHSGVEW